MKDIWGSTTPFSCKGLMPSGRSQGSVCYRVTLMAQSAQIRGITHSPGWGFSLATGWTWGYAAAGGLHLTGWDSRIPPKRRDKGCLPSSILPRKREGKLVPVFVEGFLFGWVFFCFVLFSVCWFVFFLLSQRLLLLSSRFSDQRISKMLVLQKNSPILFLINHFFFKMRNLFIVSVLIKD